MSAPSTLDNIIMLVRLGSIGAEEAIKSAYNLGQLDGQIAAYHAIIGEKPAEQKEAVQ
jgi:hypothetical protein